MDFNIGAEITAEDRDAIIVRRTRTDFTSQKACTERVGSQRNKRAEACGWASNRNRPYKPLGIPDLNDSRNKGSKNRRRGTRLFNFAGESKRSQGGYQKRAQADDIPKRLLDPVTSTSEHHPGCGYQVLKTFIDKSKTRAKACKFGSGFADQVDVSKSLGDIGRIEKDTRKQKTYFFTLKIPARAEQVLSGEKAISDDPYDSSKSQADSPKGAEQQEWRYIPEHLPEIIGNRIAEYEDTCSQLNHRLISSLKTQESERLHMYKYKALSFQIQRVFNGGKWRLLAEICRLRSKIDVISGHKWYNELYSIAKMEEKISEGMRKILGHVQRIIEVGSEYSKSHILDLIDQLSDSHVKETAVQKMLVYICEEVAMGLEELRQILLPREAHLAPTVEYDAKRLRELFRGSQSGKGKSTAGKSASSVSQRPSSNRRSLSVLPMQMKDDALPSTSALAAEAAVES